ncbi:hypothetical protein Goshw_027827, partial [Gossypium schwendimanii]|nr:hypothetical protein [Gossypium schwendimanii]
MQGDNIIHSLISACLLENVSEMDEGDSVKMHDVICDMALWITREFKHRIILLSRQGLNYLKNQMLRH